MRPDTSDLRPQVVGRSVSTRWLASVVVAVSLAELTILRLGTRTAIHIPGIEEVATPYRIASGAGRLAFYLAVVLLVVLLVSIARELHRRAESHLAACVLGFVAIAALGAFDVGGTGLTGPAVALIVAALAFAAALRVDPALRTLVALYTIAYVLGGAAAYVQNDPTVGLGPAPRLIWWAELGAIAAAVLAGPLVRRSIGRGWLPSHRLAVAATGLGLAVTVSLLASPATSSILLLWNFGLTGILPGALYGLAAASLFVAVVSSRRHGEDLLALAVVLLTLGGVGLTSTYQSAMIVAALGLLCLSGPRLPADSGGGHTERQLPPMSTL